MKIETMSEAGKKFLAQEEGTKLKPYRDSKGIPTIGVGNTFYEDGTPVKMTDKPITMERALSLFDIIRKKFEAAIYIYVTSEINQNQFDALVSITYNIGIDGFKNSTLRTLVNKDPNDPKIADAFKLWKRSGSNANILLNRRIREVELYFKPVISTVKVNPNLNKFEDNSQNIFKDENKSKL